MFKNFIWQEIQTLAIAAMFAVLMWVYAEGETINIHTLRLDVQLIAPPGQSLVIEPQTIRQVSLTVRAATSQWAQIQELERKAFALEVADDPGQQQQAVALRERLRTDARITGLGGTVVDVQGDDPQVYVERLETLSLPVTVAPGALELTGQTRVSPETAAVTAPASALEQLRDVVLQASLAGVSDQSLPENVAVTREVPLLLPPTLTIPHTTITPSRATVTFAVLKRMEAATLKLVPIWVVLPPSETARFSVDLSDENRFLRDLTISGPRDVVASIKAGEVNVWAALRLSADELERGVGSKALELTLPPGVTLSGPSPVVPFTIVRK